MHKFSEHVGFIWSIAEILRGNYKQSEYGKVVLPLTVLRRLDCVLEPTRAAVLAKAGEIAGQKYADAMREKILNAASGHSFHNTSRYSFATLLNDPDNIAANLNNMIQGFSKDAREIFTEHFKFADQIKRLHKDKLLYMVVQRFAQTDLHPDKVSNIDMGYIFEELIRRFSEQSNETAGEHFTPREVIRLMVDLLFCEDEDVLGKPGIIRRIYDPACGTGGMLSVAENYLRELNPQATLVAYGQELNDESYAICKSDMMIKGQEAANIHVGNSFSDDGLPNETFDYLISNPPFGVEWKKVQEEIVKEYEQQGYRGRFGAGLPRVSDGSLLFVQHMISKFNRKGEASRLAVVLNGSPLFTGSAGSGESEIRRWIIENDWLEAIIALPTDMFYNTGIATYIWIISNRKSAARKGKIQLIDATSFHKPMRKSLGSKRKRISSSQIKRIVELFGDFAQNEQSKIFDNTDFGFRRITVERPLRLRFSVNAERLDQLKQAKAFATLAEAKQQEILAALAVLEQQPLKLGREEFQELLKATFKTQGVDLSAPLFKTICQALSERDPEAPLCLDRKGQPEADSELRDYENVPLKEDVEEYFQREVLPHVPDAWIDFDKTKLGYEIPFNRHFYKYVPPRPLAEIDADLAKVSAEIMELLREVQG